MAAETENISVVISAKAMYEATLQKAQSDFDRYGKSVIAMGAKISVAYIGIKKAWDITSAAARYDQQEQAFTNMAASHGENARDIITNLKSISEHTVSSAAIMQSAGTAMTLGIPAEHLTKMMEIARASSKIMGETTEVMFEKLTVGLARMSKLRLDDLGILIDVEKANMEYAITMGIVGRELSDAEKKQAFMNAAMESGEDIVKRVGDATLTAADAQAKFVATMKDMTIVAGKVVISVSSALTGIAFGVSKVFAQMLKTAAFSIGKLDELLGKIPFYKATPGLLDFAEAQGAAAKESDRLMKASFGVAKGIWAEKKAVEGLQKTRGTKTGISPESSKAAKDAQKVLSIQQTKFQKLRDMAIASDLNDRELSAFRLMRQLEENEKAQKQLMSAGLMTNNVKEQFRQSEADAHLLHEKRLSDITEKEQSKRIDFLNKKIIAHETAQDRIRQSEAGAYLQTIDNLDKNLASVRQYHQDRIQAAVISGATETEIDTIKTENAMMLAKAERDYKINMAANHLKVSSGIMHNLFIASGKNNVAMFKAYQTFAIGEAIVSTYLGATRAYAQYGWPYGAIAAAAVIAAGMAQVATIGAQSATGGSTSSSVSAGGAVGVSPTVYGDSSTSSLIGTGLTPDQQKGLTINVSYNAVVVDKEGTARFFEEDLLPIINEAGERDVKINYVPSEGT